MDPPGRAESLSDPQEDDTQEHLQLEAVENSGRAAAFPNAEVSANLPCLVTDTHMYVPNVRSFPVKAPSSSHLPAQVPEDGMGVLRATQLPGDAYQWSNCPISYRPPVAPLIGSHLLNHFYGKQDDIKSMACPPKTNSMASEHGDGFNVSAQIGTTNKKQVTKPTGKEDSQHCSCKKSNCLKLYCDCFASGSFCGEACRCRECYNKHEYEDTVSESKERIQTRMPHAFAPKIISRNVSGDSMNMITPSSRHRVGCNCRKSMCAKNYCECFKAHVGCSSVCRCEDCKNTFGIKHASGEIGEMDGESETAKVNSETTQPEQCHTSFSRLTPFIQSSIGNVPNPSVAQGTLVLSCYTDSRNSPIDSISAASFAKAGQGTPTSRSYNQASGSHNAENLGSCLPHRDNLAGGIMVCPPSNSRLLQPNAFEGGDHLPVNSLPLTDESFNELETSLPNQESLSPTHTNIQETRSNLSPG